MTDLPRYSLYRFPLLYQSLMRCLYFGPDERLQQVVQLVPPDQSVVDVCCGPATLGKELSRTGATGQYTGLDVSEAFAAAGVRSGFRVERWDARTDRIPQADYVICMSALYQFIPFERELMERMFKAAHKGMIIVEPIGDLSARAPRFLRKILAWVLQPAGNPAFSNTRFRPEELLSLAKLLSRWVSFKKIRHGRDIIVCVARDESAHTAAVRLGFQNVGSGE